MSLTPSHTDAMEMESKPAEPRTQRRRPSRVFVSPRSIAGSLESRGNSLAHRIRNEPKVYRYLAIGLATLMGIFSLSPIANYLLGYWNKDYDLWFSVGWYYRHDGVLYPSDERPFQFMYPPTAALLLSILSVVGKGLFVPLLLLIQSVAWLGSILLSVRLATGKALRQDPLLYLVPTILVIPCIHDMYLLGQPNLLLLFLMLGAFVALRERHPWLAGSLIGLAAAIKAFPVMAVGYLLWRRQWKATASLIISMVILLLLLPIPFRGPLKTWEDMTLWTNGMVLKYDEGTIAQRPERAYSFKNQSIVAVANRLLRDVPANGEAKDNWYVNIASLNFKTVNMLLAGTALILGLLYVAAMPPDRLRSARTDAVEMAMLLLLILAFSPFAFNYFYVWLLAPITVVMARRTDAETGPRERRVLKGGLLTAIGVFGMSVVSVKVSQAYGNLLLADLILLGTMGWWLAREWREKPRSVPELM